MKKKLILYSLVIFGLILISIIALHFISQLNNQPKTDEGGLLSGTPCGPPCYAGIIPGVIRKDQIEDLLKKNNRWSNCEEDNSNPDSKSIICDYVGIGINKNDIVSDIDFNPGSDIEVGQVIEKYGPPDRVALYPYGPTIRGLDMALFYDDFKMRLILDSYKAEGGFPLSSKTKISNVTYFDEEIYNGFVTSKWKGYGDYHLDNP